MSEPVCLFGHGPFPAHYRFCPRCGKELLPQTAVYDIAVPKGTTWQPEAASRLVTQLLAGEGSVLVLRIVAEAGRTRWQVIQPGVRGASDAGAQRVVGAVQAYYPDAEVVLQTAPERPPAPPFRRAVLWPELWGIFPGPLVPVSELTAVDPLAALAQTGSGLGEGERLLYTLLAVPADVSVHQAGRQLVSRSAITPLQLVSWEGVSEAVARVATGHTRVEKYVRPLQRVYDEKLAQRLYRSFLAIQVDAPSAARVAVLAEAVVPVLAQFDTPYNGLRWPESGAGSPFAVPDAVQAFLTSGYWQLVRRLPGMPGHDAHWADGNLILTAEEVASLWHLPHEGFGAPGVVWVTGRRAPLPPAVAVRQSGVPLGVNLYQGVERPVYLPYADRVTHVNLIGRTRVGKTTLLHHIIHADIAQGKGVGVIDPHGDLVQAILTSSIPPEREADVVLLDLADSEYPVGLNLLAVPDGAPKEAAVAQALGILKRLFAEQWSATRMEDALYSALASLVHVPGATLRDLPRLFLNDGYREAVLDRVTDEVALEFWLEEYAPLSAGLRQQMVQPILSRVRRFYRHPLVRHIVCQPDSLDFRRIMDNGMILLASLAGEGSQSEGATIGTALIAKLQLAAMARAAQPAAQRRPFYLAVDEVQNFTTTSLALILSEAAKYGLSLTVANQYLGQLEGATLGAVLGNTGTTVIFRVGPEDGPKLAPYVRPQFEAADLVELDRFQAVVKLQVGGQTVPAFSLATAPPVAVPADGTERAARLRELSRRRYGRPRAEVEAALRQERGAGGERDEPTFFEA